MKKLIVAAVFALGLTTGIEAAPTDAVTQADLQALIERIAKLEAQNQAQAKRIAELEAVDKSTEKKLAAAEMKLTESNKKFELQTQKLSQMANAGFSAEEGTTTNESGRIFTTAQGFKYYLADVNARIFEPLSESGLKITPYGYLVFEGVYSDRSLDCDWSTDFVKPEGRGNYTTLSMQDSILGLQFVTPEAIGGWKFSGKAEFDLAGGDQNSYDFHWRHLYVDAQHEDADAMGGWSILFGQTWHLWKMVTPSEIDGAWMENAGYPYRRSPQLRVTRRWEFADEAGQKDSSLEVRLGIVKGGPGMGGDRDADGNQDNSASAWALFEGAVIYDHDAPWQDAEDDLQSRRWLVGFGGQYGRDRSQRYNGNDFEGGEDDYDSMMAMFAAELPMWRFTLKGQIFGGENLGGIQAGCGQRVLYHNWENGYVRGNGVRTVGGFIDLGFNLTEKWSFALGWGCDNPVDSDVEGGFNADGLYGIKYNDRAYIDAFYKITSNFKLGIEYARLLTSYDDSNAYGGAGGDYEANRVQFSAFYDF